eukprot:gene12603-14791_t
MDTVQQQDDSTYLTNHDMRDKLKKRKNLEGGTKDKGGPLAKLRSATLSRPSKLQQQQVEVTKSPSKSTTNAMSLHSSVPSMTSCTNANAPATTPSKGGLFGTWKRNKQATPAANHTLHRKSVRISQAIKLDEVMKIYAPLAGSEYLSSKENPLLSPQMRPHKQNQGTPQQSTPNSQSTSISPLLQAASLGGDDNKENEPSTGDYTKSPPTSPRISKISSLRTLSPIRLSLPSPQKNRFSVSTPTTPSKPHQKLDHELTTIKREVMENCEFILAKMGEYQRIVLSLPDLFMLSKDILHSEYEYLIRDTKTITKILSPLDSMTGSDTNTEVIASPQPCNKSLHRQSQSHVNSRTAALNNSQNLTEMDIIAQSISHIAKKLLGIEIEMKKPNLTEKKACTLAMFVSGVKLYLETGNVPEIPHVPTEISHSLIQSAQNTTHTYKPDEADYIYKAGHLTRKTTKGPLVVWKEQWFVLSTEKLCIYSNQNKTTKPKKEIMLQSIVSIAPIAKYEYKHCFVLKIGGGSSATKLVVRAANDRDAALWMLAVDGLPRKNFETNTSCINLYIKETLLETMSSGAALNFRRSTAGGIVRSSHGEEWTYRADGTLFNSEHLDSSLKARSIKYVWNGQLLVPAPDCAHKSFGSGKWNGVWLAWYHASGVPFLKYLWEQEANEYLNQNPRLSYKWASRGLVSKIGVGEWIVEGSVPETVVMFLQCLRYVRLTTN